MSLSKPLYGLLFAYLEQLYKNPIRTKSLTCCAIAAAGNVTAQCIAGNKQINYNSLTAYSLFGLLFGGTIPHYFHIWLERCISEEQSFGPFRKLFIERLIFMPLYQAFTLYMIPRLEQKDHETALKQMRALYWQIVVLSWKYLTLFNLFNLTIVPPMLRVVFSALIGFFWIIYLSIKRRKHQKSE